MTQFIAIGNRGGICYAEAIVIPIAQYRGWLKKMEATLGNGSTQDSDSDDAHSAYKEMLNLLLSVPP